MIGSIIVANSWCVLERTFSISFGEEASRAILHNPDLYQDPEEFKPERFLNEDGTFRDDPAISLAFGGGRRICPGRHLVDPTLFIVTARVLSVFNVTKARDQNGHEIPVSLVVQADSILRYVVIATTISQRLTRWTLAAIQRNSNVPLLQETRLQKT